MKIRKKTKIVATVGPTCDTEQIMTKMVKAGVNVFRLNFSHGDQKGHKKNIETIKTVSKKLNKPVAILLDLAGPKIRTGDFETETVTLKKGASVKLTTKKIVGTAKEFTVHYPRLPKEVKRGRHILLDDGRRNLKVTSVGDDYVLCKVVVGGVIKGRRGVNLPGTDLAISSITKKDRDDIAFGIKHKVDYFALSFVRSSKDVKDLRRIIERANSDIRIMAKIETAQALDQIDEILDVTDAVMVARGDLAIEIPREDVPVWQKSIIEKCNSSGTPVVVATQMLESMIEVPVPTRAEVSDVAHAILEGADAVMLSQETAFGAYPIDAVEMMATVAQKIEQHYPYRERLVYEDKDFKEVRENSITNAVSSSAVRMAHSVGAKLIIALSESGFTARMISRYRPKLPIVILSPNERTLTRSLLVFGCYPVKIEPFTFVSEAMDEIRDIVRREKLAKKGDKIVLSAGVPFGVQGGTNMSIVIVV